MKELNFRPLGKTATAIFMIILTVGIISIARPYNYALAQTNGTIYDNCNLPPTSATSTLQCDDNTSLHHHSGSFPNCAGRIDDSSVPNSAFRVTCDLPSVGSGVRGTFHCTILSIIINNYHQFPRYSFVASPPDTDIICTLESQTTTPPPPASCTPGDGGVSLSVTSDKARITAVQYLPKASIITVADINGDDRPNNLLGTSGDDNICGFGGDDSITGKAGNDHIEGNADNDRITGSTGNDDIQGNEGNDFLTGSLGNDKVDGGSGNDHIVGNEGNDVLTGGSGNDDFSCGPGSDTITDFHISEGDRKSTDCETVRTR